MINEKIKSKKAAAKSNRKFNSVFDENASFAFVEAYKSLRTNLKFISSATDAKCFLVTSALPDESKSTTAINLAITLAKDGQSVILVECDLRKPVLRQYLKLDRGAKGLSSLLSSQATLAECTKRLSDLGISVIPGGIVPPNPSELLSHERMELLINVLKQRFDYVILDAPPASVVTDAAVVGRLADGAILVIRSKFAPMKTIRLAMARLEAVNIKIIGAVLTRYSAKKFRERYVWGYDAYGYGEYAQRGKK